MNEQVAPLAGVFREVESSACLPSGGDVQSLQRNAVSVSREAYRAATNQSDPSLLSARDAGAGVSRQIDPYNNPTCTGQEGFCYLTVVSRLIRCLSHVTRSFSRSVRLPKILSKATAYNHMQVVTVSNSDSPIIRTSRFSRYIASSRVFLCE